MENQLEKVWESLNGCISFFLKKNPESCDLKTLFLRFKEVERVRDVFIYEKRDKEGKHFGFVPFGVNIDILKVEQMLNDI